MALEFARQFLRLRTIKVAQYQPGRYMALLTWCVAVMTSAGPVAAQASFAGGSPPAQGWRIQSNADLDLWFHGLAVVGFEGYGPLQMYDSGYRQKIAAAKKQLGLAPTLLDRRARAFKAAFDRDSTFEVMHFLPLYFIASGSGEILADMREITRENSSPRRAEVLPGSTLRAAARSVFSTPARRKTLSTFLDALEAERRDFYAEYAKDRSQAAEEITRLFAHSWNYSIRHSLAPFLKTTRARSGIVLLSPAVGGEGRSVRIGDFGTDYSIVVVGMPSSTSDYLSPASSVVRELCFSVAHEVLDAVQPVKADRIFADRLSSITAVRCGSQAIEMYLPSLSSSYQALFLHAVGVPAPRTNLPAAFSAAFPVPPGVDAGLRRALGAQ